VAEFDRVDEDPKARSALKHSHTMTQLGIAS